MPIEIKILVAVLCFAVAAFMVAVVFCAVAVASKADKEIPKKKHPLAGCVTFRDLLEAEHPENVGDEFIGGCCECPKYYRYEKEHNPKCKEMSCEGCWNRPVPKETLERLMEGEQ